MNIIPPALHDLFVAAGKKSWEARKAKLTPEALHEQQSKAGKAAVAVMNHETRAKGGRASLAGKIKKYQQNTI